MNASQRENRDASGLEDENPVAGSGSGAAAAAVAVEPSLGVADLSDFDLDALSPLQGHYLDTLRQLIVVKNEYQNSPEYEPWMMDAVKRSIYSALRDCIEAEIGDIAKAVLNQDNRMN